MAVLPPVTPAEVFLKQDLARGDGRVHDASRNLPGWFDAKAAALPRLLKEAGYGAAHFGEPPRESTGFDSGA